MAALLVFLKAPRIGQVKTRLAESIGESRALAAYRALVTRQMDALPKDASVEVHFTPPEAADDMEAWLGERSTYYPQVEGCLGARLAAAVDSAFARGAKTVICIGGDCPELVESHFEGADKKLASGDDVVFGPSRDGGYYLIALRAPQPGLFAEIPWSGSETLAASLKKAETLNLRVGLLETLYDVDTIADLQEAEQTGRITL